MWGTLVPRGLCGGGAGRVGAGEDLLPGRVVPRGLCGGVAGRVGAGEDLLPGRELL